VIALRFHVVGAHLYTCSNMSALQRMLPLDSATLVETKLLRTHPAAPHPAAPCHTLPRHATPCHTLRHPAPLS
jgi:hypothetical protein